LCDGKRFIALNDDDTAIAQLQCALDASVWLAVRRARSILRNCAEPAHHAYETLTSLPHVRTLGIETRGTAARVESLWRSTFESAASLQAAVSADTAVDAQVVPVAPKQEVWPIHVPSEYGIVLDIVHTDEGNEMLIDDGTGVITKVRADTIPKEVVTAARKAKREATRRLARK
jgi:hypothetical protein